MERKIRRGVDDVGVNNVARREMADPTLTNSSHELRRVREGALIAGVCGGIARWLGWDPTLTRVLYVVLTVASIGFPGILTYLLLWFIMPRD